MAMTTNSVKLSTGNFKETFIAVRSIMVDLKHEVVKDQICHQNTSNFFPSKIYHFFSKINFGFSVKGIGFRVSFKGFWFWFWILEKMWNIF